MTVAAERLKDKVSSWPGISVHPHRFAAREYRFCKAEVGHVHFWGEVDIPFPRPVHDFLLERNLAEQHRWVPNSGWTTFRMRGDSDVEHAVRLMRLSYLRYALRSASSPFELLETEAERLHLSPDLVVILSCFIRRKAVSSEEPGLPE